MRDEEAERPKPKPKHEIGCDLSSVSVAELRERVEMLEAEIARLKQDEARKHASQDAARAFFKV